MSKQPERSGNETAADLLAEAKQEYGTPDEREERAAQARMNLGLARANAQPTTGGRKQ